jgi:peptide/nickel transport system substrate-binding protein
MKIKSFLAVTASVMLAFSLTACGSSNNPGAASSAQSSEKTEEAAAQAVNEAIDEAAAQAVDEAIEEAAVSEETTAYEETTVTGEPVIYKAADSWMYASLNPHVDYQGWMEIGYGNVEMLFHIEPDGSVVPWLAKDCSSNDDGTVWTITLKDNVTFSDGTKVDADQIALNLEDLREKNSRYGFLEGAEFKSLDDTTLEITLKEPYFTVPNDLADPDSSIIKIAEGEDLDLAPISTGAFVVTEFVPEQKVILEKNENYWNGEPKIDGAEFTLVPEQDSQTMAMQNGEISALGSPSAEAIEIFGADPDNYDIAYAATSRLYMYYLNFETLEESQRKAIIEAVSADDFVTIMNGLIVPADGPFLPNTAFGKSSGQEHSLEKAKEILEADGYTLNDEGFYEKDGKVQELRLCYYPARSLDKLATLMQEQLAKAGIKAIPESHEDPDAEYVTTGDFEIGLYNLVSAPSGDPYYYLDLVMGDGPYNAGHYENAEIKDKLAQLSKEKDPEKRAELANAMVQQSIDDNAYGYLGFLVKATVLKKGVHNVGEDNPYHGGLNVDSVIE